MQCTALVHSGQSGVNILAGRIMQTIILFFGFNYAVLLSNYLFLLVFFPKKPEKNIPTDTPIYSV